MRKVNGVFSVIGSGVVGGRVRGFVEWMMYEIVLVVGLGIWIRGIGDRGEGGKWGVGRCSEVCSM